MNQACSYFSSVMFYPFPTALMTKNLIFTVFLVYSNLHLWPIFLIIRNTAVDTIWFRMTISIIFSWKTPGKWHRHRCQTTWIVKVVCFLLSILDVYIRQENHFEKQLLSFDVRKIFKLLKYFVHSVPMTIK